MKVFLLIALFLPTLVSAEENSSWHWRYGSSDLNGWFETYGIGDAEIEDGKITGKLYDHEYPNKFLRFEFNGKIKGNKITINFIMAGTDRGEDEISGTYTVTKFAFATEEVIIMSNPREYLVLSRFVAKETPNKALKAQPSAAGDAASGAP